MHTKDSIKSQVANLNFSGRMTNLEINSLHTILNSEEKLIDLVEGMFKAVHHKDRSSGYGVAVLTDQRILFYRKSIIGTTTQEDYPLERVSSISNRKGLLNSSISIHASNNEAIVDHISDKKGAERFVIEAKKLIGVKPISSTSNSQPVASSSNIDELKKLFELKQMGAISEEEFEVEKKKLLTN